MQLETDMPTTKIDEPNFEPFESTKSQTTSQMYRPIVRLIETLYLKVN